MKPRRRYQSSECPSEPQPPPNWECGYPVAHLGILAQGGDQFIDESTPRSSCDVALYPGRWPSRAYSASLRSSGRPWDSPPEDSTVHDTRLATFDMRSSD